MNTYSLFVQFEELYKSKNLYDCQNTFIRDGVIDPILFAAQKIKILFIAKEHNYLGNTTGKLYTDGDYRVWWNQHVHLQFAHRISEWAYGILNGFPDDYDQLSYEKKHMALRSIAFINVKKASGDSTSNPKLICEYIVESRQLLHQQIDIISPTLIVCCFRQDYYVEHLFELLMSRTESNAYSHGNWKGIPVINFYHPSSRKKKKMLYEQLKKAINQVVGIAGSPI